MKTRSTCVPDTLYQEAHSSDAVMARWCGRARLVRRHRAVACTLAAICIPVYCALYIYFRVTSNATHANDNLTLPFELVPGSLSVDVQCRRPTLELWNAGLRGLFGAPQPLTCGSVERNWIYVDNSSLRVDRSAVVRHGPISCQYTPIHRGPDDFEISRGETVKSVTDEARLTSDTFNVHCTAKDGANYSNVHLAVVPTQQIIDRSAELSRYLPDSAAGLNIIIFGFDSVSRLSWIRNLPRSYRYVLDQLGATVFEGYNVVGDGTPQALLPILTGQTEEELPEARRGFTGAKAVDGHPWIWKTLSSMGYVTQWGEESPQMGTFTYRMLGFIHQPVDHYLRTFYLAAEPRYDTQRPYCSGSEPRHRLMLGAMRQFLDAYPSRLKFTFLFHSEYTHGANNLLQWADDDLRDHLEYLLTSGHLNRSLLLLMSDHGARFQNVRASEQGKFEERLPFIAVRVPDWFGRRYPLAAVNLRRNADRLTTPFDLHETLLDIVDMNRPRNITSGRLPRGYSLFQEIPDNRTCADAAIEPHWCTCLDWRPVPVHSTEVKQAAEHVVAMINNVTSSQAGLCVRLRLGDVTSAGLYATNDRVLRFRQSSDLHGRVADLTDTMKRHVVLYQVTLKTLPSRAMFEATVVHRLDTGRYEVSIRDVSRINRYGSQPHCVAAKLPHLRPYCYCVYQQLSVPGSDTSE